MKLKDITTATFTGKSRAFCETANTVKNLLNEARQGDQVQCMVGAMEQAGIFTGLYDGNYHYYSFAFPSGRGVGNRRMGDLKFKVKVVKTDGAISNFEMSNCMDGKQTDYVATTLSGGNASLVMVGNHGASFGGGASFAATAKTEVTGTYKGGAWTGEKSIVSQGSFSMTGGGTPFSDARYASLKQGASSLKLTATSSNSFGGNAASAKVFAIIQGLNMGSPTTFALGDGTAKAAFTFASVDTNGEISWNGDTSVNLGSASGGDYYQEVHDTALPTATTPSTAFTAAQTWDCQAEGSFVAVDTAKMVADENAKKAFDVCTSDFEFGNGNDFIDCPHTGE